MRFSKRPLIWLALLAFITSPISLAEDYGIGILTGTNTGTYVQFGQNIAAVAKLEGLNVEVVTTEGSVENIQRLIDNENAGMAIVQSDVLGYMRNSKDPEINGIADKIRLIYPFYNEEVHVLANRSIQTFEQLNGKRVAVGSLGSGTRLTANNLFRLADINPSEKLSESTAKALTMLITKQIHAMIYVAGKPVKLFEMLDTENWSAELKTLIKDLHFLPLNNEAFNNNYISSSISPEDYHFIKSPVDTVAIKSMLVSFDYSSRQNIYQNIRCDQLVQIDKAIRNNIDTLRENGHTKWKEVDLDLQVADWKKNRCSANEAIVSIKPVKVSEQLSAEMQCAFFNNCE